MVAGGAGPPRPAVSPTAAAWHGEGDPPQASPLHDGFGIRHPGAGGRGAGPQGGGRGRRTRRAAGRIVQRTGVSSTSASPSTPTGIWELSASMTTSGPTSLVSPRKRVPASSPTAWTVLVTVTANRPRVAR